MWGLTGGLMWDPMQGRARCGRHRRRWTMVCHAGNERPPAKVDKKHDGADALDGTWCTVEIIIGPVNGAMGGWGPAPEHGFDAPRMGPPQQHRDDGVLLALYWQVM